VSLWPKNWENLKWEKNLVHNPQIIIKEPQKMNKELLELVGREQTKFRSKKTIELNKIYRDSTMYSTCVLAAGRSLGASSPTVLPRYLRPLYHELLFIQKGWMLGDFVSKCNSPKNVTRHWSTEVLIQPAVMSKG
jgi:hypothetical protein